MSEIPRDRELDPLLASLLLASLLLHFGFVFYLQRMDWPRESDVPDQYWHLLPPRAPLFVPSAPAPKIQAGAAGGSERRAGPKRAAPSSSSSTRGRPGSARLALVEALGGNALAGLLPAGDDRAFEHLGGSAIDPLTAAGRSLGPRAGSLEIGTNIAGETLRALGPGRVASGERSGERAVQPQVRIDPPKTLGSALPIDEIVALIHEHLGGIRACYQGPLNHNHGLAGKITLRFTVDTNGSVSSVTIEDDTLGSAEVTSCIRARVATWGFPAASRPSQFSFPLVFQSSDF